MCLVRAPSSASWSSPGGATGSGELGSVVDIGLVGNFSGEISDVALVCDRTGTPAPKRCSKTIWYSEKCNGWTWPRRPEAPPAGGEENFETVVGYITFSKKTPQTRWCVPPPFCSESPRSRPGAGPRRDRRRAGAPLRPAPRRASPRPLPAPSDTRRPPSLHAPHRGTA